MVIFLILLIWFHHISKIRNITMLIKMMIKNSSRVTKRYPPDFMSRIYPLSVSKEKNYMPKLHLSKNNIRSSPDYSQTNCLFCMLIIYNRYVLY